MSYILEALKKAQAERQLGNAPTIHAPTISPVPQAAGGRKPLVIGFAAGAVLVAGALFAWRQHVATTVPEPGRAATQVAAASQPVPQQSPSASPPPATTQAVARPTPAPQPPAADTSPRVALVPDAVSVTPGSAAATRPARVEPAVHPKAASTAPAPAPSPAHAPALAQAMPTPAAAPKVPPRDLMAAPPVPTAADPAAATRQAAAAPAPSADESLRTVNELPEQIRYSVPKVAFGGYMYSPNPADRLVLVDKALRHEGEEVAPGLVLEKLLPKAAVMNYRGYRYRVPL